MFSAPYTLSNPDLQTVMTANYGEYDKDTWRLFRWSSGESDFIEFDSIADSLTPGNAFWLITKEGNGFILGAGQTTAPYDSFEIHLNPGWNQIGNPFAIPVAWEDILTSGTVDAPVAYNGTEYVYQVSVLDPWEGYFVYNAEQDNVTLTVPFRKAAASASKAAALPIAYEMNIQASMELLDRHYQDTQTRLGFLSDGEAFSYHEAPSLDRHFSLSIFEDKERLSGSYRALSTEGESWDLVLESNLNAKRTVQLFLMGTGDLPEGWDFYLIDLDRGLRLGTDENKTELTMRRSEKNKQLRLIFGSERFAETQSGGVSLLPLEFALYQNYPNPFNPSTTIEFQLKETTDVILQIFNVMGDRVWEKQWTLLDAGNHQVQWEGIGLSGESVAAGIYMYRILAGKFTTCKKMLFIQ